MTRRSPQSLAFTAVRGELRGGGCTRGTWKLVPKGNAYVIIDIQTGEQCSTHPTKELGVLAFIKLAKHESAVERGDPAYSYRAATDSCGRKG